MLLQITQGGKCARIPVLVDSLGFCVDPDDVPAWADATAALFLAACGELGDEHQEEGVTYALTDSPDALPIWLPFLR